jgi:hypothetical protein
MMKLAAVDGHFDAIDDLRNLRGEPCGRTDELIESPQRSLTPVRVVSAGNVSRRLQYASKNGGSQQLSCVVDRQEDRKR